MQLRRDPRMRKDFVFFERSKMDRSNIRVKAYAVFRRGNEILVNEVRESDGTLIGFRIPGGHVEFGEKAFDAVQRELMEEFKAEAENYKLLPVMESTYVYQGKPGHEVIFAYTADFKDKAFYQQDKIMAFEDNGTPFTLFWLDFTKLTAGTDIFPTGLINLLT
jgi:ADP-ribose pyrophosphatase YjhB (NUDIX family)